MKTAIVLLALLVLAGCAGAGGKACTMDAKICPDGSSVGRDASRNCEFAPCPEKQGCNGDVKECDDGHYVNRNPNKNCDFDSCSIFG